jgi:hypothetical protein
LNNVILVRFTFDHKFDIYLAYPYFFMHEYVAHIFALDHNYDNEIFNDGWLLHAADVFLAPWKFMDLQPPLALKQVEAFDRFLLRGWLKHHPTPWKGYWIARHLDELLIWQSKDNRKHFWAMTWELAAFEPREGESDFWPTQFINCLDWELRTNPQRLRRKIEDAPDVRTLFEMLLPLR